MIQRRYAVLLHGRRIGGMLGRDAFTTFRFDRDYWERDPADRPVLGQWFERHRRRRPRASGRVPAWFSGLLPEGRLRERVAREQGVSVYRELDLLAGTGGDLPGAVELRLEGTPCDEAGGADSPSASPRGRVRASLAGMTMKFSLRRQGERLALPAHGEDGDWILKTPDAAYPGLVDNEYAMMRLARAIGIEVPEVELLDRERIDELGPGAWTSEERRAYAVRRFDRSASGRIHIEDFAQVLGRFGAGDDKYRSNVQTVAGLAFRGRDEASLREMVRRTVFNLLIGNGDAHLKNWSLIYPDRRVAVLSPAYDLVCTSVHLPNPEDPELGLPFFEAERLSQVCREHFRRLQETLEVDGEHVLAVLDDTLERFFDTWTPAATEYVPTQVRTWITDHAEDTRRRLRG